MKEIAAITGLSSSYISQLERDLINPSVDSLKRICDAYDLPLATFFDEQKFGEMANGDIVVRSNQRKSLIADDSRVKMYLLSPNLTDKIEMIYIVAQIGGSSGELKHVHEGEECGFVINGTMELTIDNVNYTLNKGDSIAFSSSSKHSWKNIGQEELVSVWAITPPSF